MPLDEMLRRQIEDVLANGIRATREDLLKNYPLEMTINRNWEGYCNPRVTAGIDSLSRQEVTHLIFTPLVEAGIMVIQAGTEKDKGAEPFVRNESGRTGLVRLRSALNDFGLVLPKDQNLKFAVDSEELHIGDETRKVLYLTVKKPKRKRVVTREAKTPEQKAAAQKERERKAAEREAVKTAARKSEGSQTSEPTSVAAASLGGSETK
jgi:hypothetical protein